MTANTTNTPNDHLSNNMIANTQVTIMSDFDSGSIEIVNISASDNICLRIRQDTNSHFAQWFYFAVTDIANKLLDFHILDIKQTAYPKGFEDYKVCISYDNEKWQRLDTTYYDADKDELRFSLSPSQTNGNKIVYFAYFEPYPYSRHQKLIQSAKCNANDNNLLKHEILGQTIDGRDIDLLVLGNNKIADVKKVWVIARQHPGETMAQWFMEGMLTALLDNDNEVARELLTNTVIYLVPNMNPDGSYLGNLRTNGAGINLNRQWQNPSKEESPEVFYVRNKMLETGVDIFLDIHGDEALPYLFTDGCADIPSFSARQEWLEKIFTHQLSLCSQEYQTAFGYEFNKFSAEMLTIATKWVGEQFDCLALTLEMPFKDTLNVPNHQYGWNAYRSSLLGQNILNAISNTVAQLFNAPLNIKQGDSTMNNLNNIKHAISNNQVVLYMKGTPKFPLCGFSGRVVKILAACGLKDYLAINVLEDDTIRQDIKTYSNWPTIPQLYVAGEFIGGADIVANLYASGELQKILQAAIPSL